MPTNNSLVVVSNRLPTSVSRGDDGELQYATSNGGLATAMSSLDSENRIWIGWPGIASDDITDKERAEITEELAKQSCIPVFLTSEQIALFYEGYANDTLWPMFHYFQSYVQYNEEY